MWTLRSKLVWKFPKQVNEKTEDVGHLLQGHWVQGSPDPCYNCCIFKSPWKNLFTICITFFFHSPVFDHPIHNSMKNCSAHKPFKHIQEELRCAQYVSLKYSSAEYKNSCWNSIKKQLCVICSCCRGFSKFLENLWAQTAS